jgi:hypothetical protein
MLTTTVEVNTIAAAWVSAEHQPNHPSYAAFVAETLTMFRSLSHNVTPYNSGSPYANIEELFDGLDRNHLFVYTGGSRLQEPHPLSQMTEYGFTMNVVFRAVHDVFGHYSTRCDFSLYGEIEAYFNHKQMYSAEALPALYGETVGQLCYFCAYGDFVPTQKCAILPVLL